LQLILRSIGLTFQYFLQLRIYPCYLMNNIIILSHSIKLSNHLKKKNASRHEIHHDMNWFAQFSIRLCGFEILNSRFSILDSEFWILVSHFSFHFVIGLVLESIIEFFGNLLFLMNSELFEMN
jgi:hypothetical protein